MIHKHTAIDRMTHQVMAQIYDCVALRVIIPIGYRLGRMTTDSPKSWEWKGVYIWTNEFLLEDLPAEFHRR